MAFVAALPEVLAAVGEAGAAGGAAAGAGEAAGAAGAGEAAGGASGGGGFGTMLSKVMPIPRMGSSGAPSSQPKTEGNPVLNGDQFR